MAQIVTNIIQNSLSGMVAGAVTTVGGYAGDAINGVGNLIEAKGQAVGDGIAKKFEGLGSGFTSYGSSVRTATAPNAGYAGYSTTKKTSVPATKKAGAAAQKPSSVSGLKKPLPSIPERKLLTAPPTKSIQGKGPSQGTYNKAIAPYKQNTGAKRSNYAPSMAAMSTVTQKTNKTAKSQAGKIGNVKLNQAQKSLSPMKSNTNAAGKVVPEKRSLPGKSGKTASATAGKTISNEPYKGPLQLGGKTGFSDNKSKTESPSKGGYQGPLNISGIVGNTGSQPNVKKNEKKPASVAGGAPNRKPGGYGGPLELGSLV